MLDLIIIGAGPAGMSACLYASRAGLDVLILDGSAPGGKLNVTAQIENYPGLKPTPGPEIAFTMYESAMNFGAKMAYEEALDIAVIGGGNSALEEAMYLATLCHKVHLLVRRDVFRAEKVIQDRLSKVENIEVHFKRKPKEILEQNQKVCGLLIENSDDQTTEELKVNGIFPFIGLDPMTQCAKSLNIVSENGYIDANENMETAVKGIFVAGDVRNKQLRQVVTATNDGAIAGQYIASLK